MKPLRITALVLPVALLMMLGAPALAGAQERLQATLQGFEEVPAVSTTGSGEFLGIINASETLIGYQLSYTDLEGTVTAAHIHLGQPGVDGGIIAFLCGGGDKPACPPSPEVVRGRIDAADIIGPTDQGIDAVELAEVLNAIRSFVTYANVHTDKFPDGEIRGQIAVQP
ncbi:MAG: CHRD domain-containing protein [candidate division NC10 bacterium]|nr:CHRD domain-containing protein [candidate division NC10 bacterium]